MANRIKGITIEIGGNTTKLTDALRSVNKSLSASQKALQDVNKLLKFDPKNTELLRQKQEYLKKSVEDTKQKLQQEKDALAQLKASDATGETVEQQRALERQIADTEGQLKSFQKQLKDFGSVGAQQVAAVGEKFKAVGEKIESVGKTLTKYVTTPIAGLFTASGKSALDYGDSVAKVATIMDKSEASVSDMKDQILALSDATGKGAGEIAEATYQAISASVNTADAVEFVGTAANLAKAGFLETADAVDVLTTIINAYGYDAADAAGIADQLVQTQNKGKTTVQELAGAMGTVIPTAAALNIPLEQLNTSYVLMTKQGINTANATTYLNSMFTELANGGSDVSEILQNKTGKSFGQLMQDGATLGDILELIYESVDGDSEAFLNLWGNVRAGKAALAMANGGAEEFNSELVEMCSASGNVASALGELDTPAARLRKSLNKLKNAALRLGEILMPVAEKIAAGIEKIADWWDKLDPKTQKAITTALAIAAAVGPLLVIGGKLIAGIGILMTFAPVVGAVFSGVAGPILIVVGVIAALVAAGVLLYQNWGSIKQFGIDCWTELQELWESVSQYFQQVWSNAQQKAEEIAGNVRQNWEVLKTATGNAWAEVERVTGAIWSNIQQTVAEHGGGVKGTIAAVMDGSLSIWTVGFDLIDQITGGKLSEARQTAEEKLEEIRGKFREKMDAAADAVRGAIEKIKGFFKFEWSLPEIKLPHFSITGNFSLNPPSIPTIGVSWYAKAMQNGMILDSPTIFGALGGKLLGAGDAGAEAVVGVGSLRRMIREAVGAGGTSVGNINITVNAAPGQDEQAIAVMALDLLQQQIMRRARA